MACKVKGQDWDWGRHTMYAEHVYGRENQGYISRKMLASLVAYTCTRACILHTHAPELVQA